jgi:hypothetical protein
VESVPAFEDQIDRVSLTLDSAEGSSHLGLVLDEQDAHTVTSLPRL